MFVDLLFLIVVLSLLIGCIFRLRLVCKYGFVRCNCFGRKVWLRMLISDCDVGFVVILI